jgi:serine/threonine-protein kinase
MAKQAWHRFSNAREFGDTLQKALRSEPIERFDRAKIHPRIERIKKACAEGDYQFGLEILTELESEGHIDPDMAVLRIQIEQAVRQKTIRQLLEGARTRMEEDEYPLALQKIQDVLNVDATNMDALNLKKQIERQRGEKQIENWMRLVRDHLDNQLYSQARQGLQEILKINNSHTKARELLVEVDRTEQEAVKLWEEQQKLYDAALTAYKNGEISTALSKLERVLELNRRSLKSAPSDRDAQYQSLYNQIRSERDAARNAYAEARKQLEDHKFARVLEICEQFLEKHPGDPLFQALKIEAEEAQRQEQSAAIAEVNRRIDAEPDLDKKYNIVKQALENYPNEAHFNSSLKLIRDRRDLVNSIVGRARQYEERSQFNDAAGQWDILRNIYPLYPGLDFEVERLGRRREEQIQNERKARWVEQVDRYFGAGKYDKARETCEEALREFPDDPELKGLHGLAGQGIKRSAEASVLLREGQDLCAQHQYDEGLDALRKAEHLDPPNTAIHAALLGALVQRARELMSKDWHLSESLIKEAGEIDSGDPVVRALSSLIDDHRRQDAVNGILLDARNLQAGGELQTALKRVEAGLESYPNEIRLSQLHNTLRAAAAESRRIETAPQAPFLTQTVAAPATTETFAQQTGALPREPGPSGRVASPVSPSAQAKARIPLWWTAIAAGILLIAAALLFNRLRAPSNAPVVSKTAEPVTAPVHPAPSGWVALPLDLPFNLDLLNPAPERIRLTLESNAAEGTVFVNGTALQRPMTNGARVVTLPPGTYKLKVAQEGYEDSPEQTVEVKSGDTNLKPLSFTLAPIQRPATLMIQSAPAGASVLIDGQPAGAVDSNGSFSREMTAGPHSIGLRKQGFEDLNVSREFKAGEKASLTSNSMKPYGTLAFKVSPVAARITYRREGDATASSVDNGQSVSLKSGSYAITVEADNFRSRSDTVDVASGKSVTVDWGLQPVAVAADTKLTPARVFENGSSWVTDKSGWWVHDAKGYSFLRGNQGTFVFDILKEEQKGFFRSKTKKVGFVADYRDEQNHILYTIDGRTLTRKLVASERSVADVKAPLGGDGGSVYRLIVEITPGTVMVRDRNGKVLDSIRRLGAPGKFGFEDDVTLSVASAP